MQDAKAAPSLKAERCYIHIERSASARCPSCSRFYCRECVVEHRGRMLCQSCIQISTAAAPEESGTLLKRLGGIAATTVSAILLLAAFYLAGLLINSAPPDFHRNPSEFYLKNASEDQ